MLFHSHATYVCSIQKEDLDPGFPFTIILLSRDKFEITSRAHVCERRRPSGGTGNLRKSRLDLTSDRVRFGARPIVAGGAWRTSATRRSREPAAKLLTEKVAEEGTRRMRRRRRNSGCVSKGALYSNKVRYN